MSARRLTFSGIVIALALTSVVATGCAMLRGPADRVDEFVAAGQECTGSWWLGNLRAGTNDEAGLVAEQALREVDVSAEAFDSAAALLELSMNDQEWRSTSQVDFESEAYMLAVTLHVKHELELAGYPDIDRVIEVWTDHSCS